MTTDDPQTSPGRTPTDRTGLLIIRAWTEPGSTEPLRAQVRLTTDISAGFERTLTLSRSADVCAVVREWLAQFCAGSGMFD